MDNQRGEYIPPNQYTNNQSVPLNQNSLPVINRNQETVNPSEIQNLQASLKSNSSFVSCPFCRNQAMTRVESNCSYASVLCCVCTSGVFWLLFQACRSKDINCNNASHFCNRCGNNLANYRAC